MDKKVYEEWIHKSKDQKQKILENLKQQAEPKSSPLGSHSYPEVGFVQFKRLQYGKPINIATYRNKAKDPKALVIIIPPLGSHQGYSSHLAAGLAKANITAVGLDFRGFGKSEGQRFFINSMEQIEQDVAQFVRLMIKMHQNLPVFIFVNGSVSITIQILMNQLKHQKIWGVLFAGGMYKKPEMGAVTKIISGFALKVIPDKVGLLKPDFAHSSRNKTNTKILQQDPLINHEKVYAGNIKKMLELQQKLTPQKVFSYQFPPLVIIQGQKDKMGQAIHAVEFFQKCKTKEKQLWYYKDAWGVILIQEEYYDIEKRTIQWIHKQIGINK